MNKYYYDYRDNKLYELVKKIKPSHRKRLLSVLRLDFFKIKSHSILLLEEIIGHIESKSNSLLSKAYLIEKTGIRNKDFNHSFSTLFSKTCKFLYALDVLKEYEKEYQFMLTSFFLDNGLAINSNDALDRINSTLKKEKRTHEFHYRKMKYHEFRVTQNRSNREDIVDFCIMNKELDAFYVENKLRFLCEEINRNNITNSDSAIFSSNKEQSYFLNWVKEQQYFNSASVEVYFHIYNMLTNSTEASYKRVQTILDNDLFHLDIQDDIVRFLMNQCIKFINEATKIKHYATRYIELVELLEKKYKLLNSNSKFPLDIFQNFLFASLIVKPKEWIQAFVQKRFQQVDTNNQAFIEHMFNAIIELHFSNLKEASKHISKIKDSECSVDEDIFLWIRYYVISIKIFYTQNNFVSATSKAEALRIYVHRAYQKKKIAEHKKIIITNFTRFFNRIANISKKEEPKKWAKLQKDYSLEKEQTAYTQWLDGLI